MDNLSLSIRPFQDDDEAAVIALWRTCFPNDPPWDEPTLVIRQKREIQRELFLVGLLDHKIIATAIAGYDGFRGWVYHLATAPEYRRRGAARSMMAEVERRLASLGCPKLNLQVRSTNEAVVAFYRALGYTEEDRISFGKRLGGGAG